jgi:hypothetical protein
MFPRRPIRPATLPRVAKSHSAYTETHEDAVRTRLRLSKQLRAAGERGRTVQASNIRVALDRLAKGLGGHEWRHPSFVLAIDIDRGMLKVRPMDEDAPAIAFDPALGAIEPHTGLLTVPPDDQRIYKVMTVEDLLRSVSGRYLHFNRVDSYKDFPGADPHDGEQLGKDRDANARLRFEKAPDFSGADYYDQSRRRTYACCFTLENTEYIWREYANGGPRGKVGVVFDFAKLRATVNETMKVDNAIEHKGLRCKQIFSVSYGIVDYVSWADERQNLERMPNPIRYTFLKDKRFAEERELRIALSALGIGHFVLNDGTLLEFPPALQLGFDFRQAIGNGTISEILADPKCDQNFLRCELKKQSIVLG